MSLGKNRLESRLESLKQETVAPSFSTLPVEFFGYQKVGYGVANFVAEFQPVMGNFLTSIMLDDIDVDSVLEEATTKFLESTEARGWHKSVCYRPQIAALMTEVLLKNNTFRKTGIAGRSDGQTHLVDLGTYQIKKQLSMVWRNHLVNSSWEALKQKERQTARPYYSVLQRRYAKPWLTNDRLLKDLSDVFRFVPNKQSFRVFLYRAEQHFARRIVMSVIETVHLPNSKSVQQEMVALDLAHYWERIVKGSQTSKLSET